MKHVTLPTCPSRSASEIALREMKAALKAVIDLHQATWETLEGSADPADPAADPADPAASEPADDGSSGDPSHAATAPETGGGGNGAGNFSGRLTTLLGGGGQPSRMLRRGLSHRHLAVDTEASSSAMQQCERAQMAFDKAVRSVEEHMAISENETFLGKQGGS